MMDKLLCSVLCAILLSSYILAAPAGSALSASQSSSPIASGTTKWSSTASSPEPSATVPLASDDPNPIAWGINANIDPLPIRGSLGANILGPQNLQIDRQNPDLLAPPTTDAGSMYVCMIL